MIGSRGACPVKPLRGSSTGVPALRVTAHPFRNVSAKGARAEGDSAQMKPGGSAMRICRWCGAGYLLGLYRAHMQGRTHRDWQRQECAFQRIRTTNPAESGHLIQSKADTVGAERRRDGFGC